MTFECSLKKFASSISTQNISCILLVLTVIFGNTAKIFCRSSKYELDCLEEVRQDKIQRKMERERRQSELRKGIKTDQDKDSVETPVIIVPCKHQPPFWWKQEVSESEGRFRIDAERGVVPQADKSEYKTEFLRWQKEPDVFAENLTDPCRRRDELALYVFFSFCSN